LQLEKGNECYCERIRVQRPPGCGHQTRLGEAKSLLLGKGYECVIRQAKDTGCGLERETVVVCLKDTGATTAAVESKNPSQQEKRLVTRIHVQQSQ
jgi:hypothetical protein